jgi:hypothetical protein
MKKNIASILIALLSTSAFSQGKLVIFGGVNKSVFHYKEAGHFSADIKSHPGADAGLSLKSAKWKYINPGVTINYRQKSLDITAEWGGLGGGNRIDMSSKLGYLNLNLYPEIGIGTDTRIYFQPGVFIGGLFSAKEHGTETYWLAPTQPEQGVTTVTNEINGNSGYIEGPDFGIRLNAGIEFGVQKSLKLVFEAGISRGMNNTGNESFGSYAETFNSTNYSFTFGIAPLLKSTISSPKE